MTVLDRVLDVVPRSSARVPMWVRIAAVPIVAALVLAGVWSTGALISDDFRIAQTLTGLFFAAGGAVAVLVGLRWRALALPVIATYAIVSLVVGGFLFITSTRDVVASGPVTAADSAGTEVLGSGLFASGAHQTTGAAQVLATADGSRLLTLTEFETDPGPDLRVYLVPGDGSSVTGGVDLGGLKGNRGDQEYSIPADLDLEQYGTVVIWCRAFTVNFGAAQLTYR